MNIKDLVVLPAWDVFLINSSLVLPSLLLQEGKYVSYCFERRVYSSHAWLGELGDFRVRRYLFVYLFVYFSWGEGRG